jgi:flagellar biosynthesis protein FliR
VGVDVPTNELVALMLAAVRAAAWLVIAPPFAGKMMPATVKALLSVALALPLVPELVAKVPDPSSPQLIMSLFEQVVIGTALGFLTSLLFAAVQAAGSLIDLFGGFSVALAFDPFGASGNGGAAVFGRFYNVVATTLLFVTNGHMMVLRGFAQSYHTLPLDGTMSLHTLQGLLTTGLAQMFIAALQIAGPLAAVLFCADIGLGLLNRAAPALNAFTLGFPVKILLVLTAAGMGLALLPRALTGLVDQIVKAVVAAAGG